MVKAVVYEHAVDILDVRVGLDGVVAVEQRMKYRHVVVNRQGDDDEPCQEGPEVDKHRDPESHEPPDEALPIVAHELPRTVGVRQSQRGSAQVVRIVVDDVIPFARQLVHPVDIGGMLQMILVQWQILRLAVLLASPCIDDLDSAVLVSAGFQNG